MYAVVEGDEVLYVVAELPPELNGVSIQDQEAAGYYEVQETLPDGPYPYPPPESGVWESSVQLVDGIAMQVWAIRPFTEEEILTTLETANKKTIEQTLATDWAAMQAIIDSTNADINSNPAVRIKAMARAQRRMIRLALSQFDGVD